MVDLKIKLFLFFIIISTDLYAVKISPLALIYQGEKKISEVESLFGGRRVNDNVGCYELVFIIDKVTKDFIFKFYQPSNEEDDLLECGIVNSSFVGRVKESEDYAGKICSSNAYFQFSKEVPYAIAIESNEKINNLSKKEKNKLRDQILRHFEYASSLDCYDELMTIGKEEDKRKDKRKDIYNFHDLICGKYVEKANECSKCRVIKQLGGGKFNTTRVVFFNREEMDEG